MLIFIDGTRAGVRTLKKGDWEKGLHRLKPWEAMATQSLIQIIRREMLVLEERELVYVEVKGKKEQKEKEWGGQKRQEENLCDREMCGYGFANVCVCIHICAHAHVRKEKNRAMRQRKAKQGFFTQREMMQRAQAGTEVLPQDRADNPLSRKHRSKWI